MTLLHIEYPMLDDLHKGSNNGFHIGMFEFVAEEGMFIMPYRVCTL
jgi:hypothetical protein